VQLFPCPSCFSPLTVDLVQHRNVQQIRSPTMCRILYAVDAKQSHETSQENTHTPYMLQVKQWERYVNTSLSYDVIQTTSTHKSQKWDRRGSIIQPGPIRNDFTVDITPEECWKMCAKMGQGVLDSTDSNSNPLINPCILETCLSKIQT
jgi:hypothetical protein